MPSIKPKILFVVMEDWAFLSHRLPMARSARDSGFDVVIATRVSKHLPEIEAEGFRVVHMDPAHASGKAGHRA